MLFSSLYSLAQDNVPAKDTIIYLNGKKVLVNVLSVKTGVAEYKKVDSNKSVFFIALSSIKAIKTYDGRIFNHKKYINTLDSIQRVNDFKRDKIKDSLRVRNRENNSLKRKGHVLLTSNLVSLIPDKSNLNYKNGFVSIGLLYYPSSNFSIGFLFNQGLPYKKVRGPVLKKGIDFNVGLSFSKRRPFDFGLRGGVAVMEFNYFTSDKINEFNYREITIQAYNTFNNRIDAIPDELKEYNGRFFRKDGATDPSPQHVNFEKRKKLNLVPYLGLEFNYQIVEKFSFSSVFGFKYDIYRGGFSNSIEKNVINEKIYDFNSVLISDNVYVTYPEDIELGELHFKKVLRLFFRFSVNYHFTPRKK